MQYRVYPLSRQSPSFSSFVPRNLRSRHRRRHPAREGVLSGTSGWNNCRRRGTSCLHAQVRTANWKYFAVFCTLPEAPSSGTICDSLPGDAGRTARSGGTGRGSPPEIHDTNLWPHRTCNHAARRDSPVLHRDPVWGWQKQRKIYIFLF